MTRVLYILSSIGENEFEEITVISLIYTIPPSIQIHSFNFSLANMFPILCISYICNAQDGNHHLRETGLITRADKVKLVYPVSQLAAFGVDLSPNQDEGKGWMKVFTLDFLKSAKEW